jgi:hypothetical protein
MSIVRNRELSQFGSFIYIDNTTQNIGITTDITPYIGIGTPLPQVKLHVVGDTNINGNFTVSNGSINASSYTLNGNPLVNASIEYWNLASNGQDVYRINGNIGIGTSIFTQKLTVLGNISAGQFISTVTSGTAPFVVSSTTEVANLNASLLRGKIPPNGLIVGTTDNQTLTNKTLTSPLINNPSISNPSISSGISLSGSTSGITILQPSAIASGVLSLPATTDTVVARNTSDILTNKTISASSNTIIGLTNNNLSGSAAISNQNLQNSTISGVSLGNNLNNLIFSSYLSSSGTYNGSTARTVSVAGTSLNTPNTLVARDVSGDFSAGSINCSNLSASFSIDATDINCNTLVAITTITAQDVNSTSDINLKTNIKTVENALDTIDKLRGVSFDWKLSGKNSYGVIAQELEEVLPELVNSGENKSVNYNGIIAILIEAIKDLKKEIEDIKNTK